MYCTGCEPCDCTVGENGEICRPQRGITSAVASTSFGYEKRARREAAGSSIEDEAAGSSKEEKSSWEGELEAAGSSIDE